MKQFDDIFRENVNKAFSGYNADHLADQGWNSLEAAGKGERRRIKMIAFWTRAAVVTLLVGSSVLIGYLALNRQSSVEIVALPETDAEKVIPDKELAGIESPASEVFPETSGPAGDGIEVKQKEALQAQFVAEITVVPEQPNKGIILLHSDTTLLPVVAENRFLLSEDSVNLVYEKALKEFMEGETVKEIAAEEEKRYGRTTFITGLSGLLAHVKDASSTAPGVSVGFYVDQKITERISLRPGLALAINSLGIDNGTGNEKLAYSLPLIDGNSGTPDSYSGHLNMIAMELPLNVVFRVFEKERSGVYLSAGASTMIYISQQFTGDFVNEYTMEQFNAATGSMTSEKRYSTVTVENSYGSFSRTDYLGLANFSAGYTFPYGKTATLLIEPFLQLPFSDLTALNLRVRYGGISMKIRFGTDAFRKGKQ